MNTFLLIGLYIFIGFLLKGVKLPIKELPFKLNRFIINFALPAIILLQIPKLEFSSTSFIPMFVAWCVMGTSAVIVYYLSKRLNFTKEVTGALMFMAVLTNSSFVGLPVISGYFGEESLPFILLYDQLGTVLALATYGTIIGAYYSSKGEVSSKVIVGKILSFPPLIALVFAMVFNDLIYPIVVVDILKLLALTIVPFALISVGMQLKFKLPKEEVVPFSLSLFLKLFVAPLVAIIICTIFSWQDLLIAKVTIMQAGMAPMITAAAVASMLGLAPRLCNAIVGYGIALSFITSWILYTIIK